MKDALAFLLFMLGVMILLFVGGLVLILVPWWCLAMLDITVSTGYRDGCLQKLSDKGIFWVSTEGELTLPGFCAHRGTGNVWTFSVPDAVNADQLRHLKPLQLIRLHYRQVLASKWWISASTYLVERVEILP